MTAETSFDQSKRDFIFPFARRNKSRGNQPPRRSNPPSLTSPQPPDQEKLVTRREALGVLIIAGTAITAVLSKPWDWFTQPDQESEFLRSLVTQAKKREVEFNANDLSDKESRSRYIDLLADIFTQYYSPLGISKEQLHASTILIDSKDFFEDLFIEKNQDPAYSRDYLKKEAAETPAFTIDDDKTYLNTNDDIYQRGFTSNNPLFPKDWNPLKSLRLTLFHEFSHLIVTVSHDPVMFSVTDEENILTDKKITGFRIQGYTNRRELLGVYASIDEASVELLSKYINTDLFNSYISMYGDAQGENVRGIIPRLEEVIDAAKLSKVELALFHKASNLRGFLLLLTERGGLNSQRNSELSRLDFGLSLLDALIQNNQATLQDYMNSARRFTR